MNVLADVTLPGLKEAFPDSFFKVSTYTRPEEIKALLPGQELLLCRSTLKVTEALLAHHSLKYLATASSGTDHINHTYLNNQGIQLIDAKGSNAQSVADYVLSCLAYVSKQQLIKGEKAGIIGMGAVGSEVYPRLQAAGFKIHTYDPLKEMREPNFQSCALEELFDCDLLCIHAELHTTQPYPSARLIEEQVLSKLKSGCVLINAARGGIVDEKALLHTQNSLIYCTDVYENEPRIDKQIVALATLCTPHIAGHSLEAKYAAVSQVSQQIHDFLGRPHPQFARPPVQTDTIIDAILGWEDQALAFYNPIQETQTLKSAVNIESSFLSLRKNHQTRHNFETYIHVKLEAQNRILFGLGE